MKGLGAPRDEGGERAAVVEVVMVLVVGLVLQMRRMMRLSWFSWDSKGRDGAAAEGRGGGKRKIRFFREQQQTSSPSS